MMLLAVMVPLFGPVATPNDIVTVVGVGVGVGAGVGDGVGVVSALG